MTAYELYQAWGHIVGPKAAEFNNVCDIGHCMIWGLQKTAESHGVYLPEPVAHVIAAAHADYWFTDQGDPLLLVRAQTMGKLKEIELHTQ